MGFGRPILGFSVVFGTAALPVAAMAQQQPAGFRISDHRWYELQRTETGSARVYMAFANVRRLPGGRVRHYTLFFNSSLSRPLAVEEELDCGANTTRMIAGGGAQGDSGELYGENMEPVTTREGSTGRRNLRTVCDGAGWREVADPMRAGLDHIGGFAGSRKD